jgi:hypothetical protein
VLLDIGAKDGIRGNRYNQEEILGWKGEKSQGKNFSNLKIKIRPTHLKTS